MESVKHKYSFRFALLLAVFSALGPFTIDTYLSAFPQMTLFFGTSASKVQLSLTACMLGMAIGMIVMGSLSDVHGRRKPLLYAMVVYFMTSIGCAFAPSIEVLIALRFIQGFATSAGVVISRAIVSDLFNGVELTKFFSLLMMFSNVAPLLAPLAGSAVLSFTSWTGIFLFLGFLGICLTALTVWGLKETLPVEKRVPNNFSELLGNFNMLLKDRSFMGYALIQGFLFVGVFAYISGTPFVYQNLYGVSPHLFSILFSLNGISLILGSQVVKQLAGRVQDRIVLLIGLAIAFITGAVVLFVVLSHGPLAALVIPLFFFVGSVGIISSISFTLAMESQANMAGSASALLGVTPVLFGAVTSPLVGIAGEYSALPFGVMVFTASLLAVAAYFILVKQGEKAAASKSQIVFEKNRQG